MLQCSPTETVDVVVPEQIVASVTHVVQDSETGPGSKEFWKLFRVVVVKLILVISSLAAQAGKVVAVCCVQAEASHSPGHQTSGRNNCNEKKRFSKPFTILFIRTEL